MSNDKLNSNYDSADGSFTNLRATLDSMHDRLKSIMGQEQNQYDFSGKSGFLFLPSYFESYLYFLDMDEELANEFLVAVVIYGITQEEYCHSPAVQATMASVKRTINASIEKRERKSRNSKKPVAEENTKD